MNTRPADESPLSPHRAFVVQLREQAKVESGQWVGRIEHVTSGQATHFQITPRTAGVRSTGLGLGS